MRTMCAIELKDRKKVNDLMLMLGMEWNDRSVSQHKRCALVWTLLRKEVGHILHKWH